jgi:hypothetical protein
MAILPHPVALHPLLLDVRAPVLFLGACTIWDKVLFLWILGRLIVAVPWVFPSGRPSPTDQMIGEQLEGVPLRKNSHLLHLICHQGNS